MTRYVILFLKIQSTVFNMSFYQLFTTPYSVWFWEGDGEDKGCEESCYAGLFVDDDI